MSSSGNESDRSEASAYTSHVKSVVDRIRRNDESYAEVYFTGTGVEILDALKTNTVVKKVTINSPRMNEEAYVKLLEVMKCNKSVESLSIDLQGGILRERLFAAMAISGGWSSIHELFLDDDYHRMSLRVSEDVSNFILQCENLRTLKLGMAGDQNTSILEILSRKGTKVQRLNIRFSMRNGGRRLAAALERCTCITELRLEFQNHEMDFFQMLFIESIPKMLGLKKIELEIDRRRDQGFFDMVGRCIGEHQGALEELTLMFHFNSVNVSIAGLAPALRRLKAIRLYVAALSSQQIGELSEGAADCETLEEFGYYHPGNMSTDDFKAICQLLPKFPSLKRVTHEHFCNEVDLREKGRFTAFLEMVKTSKTIEQVSPFQCGNAEEAAGISQHCRNNMMHNQIKCIRQKGLLAAKVPNSAWPLILKEFSDMPDVLYYLLQQKNGAIIKWIYRKQDFD